MTVRTQKFDAGQRRDQHILAARAGPQCAVQVEHAVGLRAGDRRDAPAQRGLGEAPVPYLVVVGQEKAALLARAADQQRDVARSRRRRRVERLRRQVGPVDDRAEIVAVEQVAAPDVRPRARPARSPRPAGRPAPRAAGSTFAASDAEFVQHRLGQRVAALAGRDPDRRAALDNGAMEQARAPPASPAGR